MPKNENENEIQILNIFVAIKIQIVNSCAKMDIFGSGLVTELNLSSSTFDP